jgi:hypothetical protein
MSEIDNPEPNGRPPLFRRTEQEQRNSAKAAADAAVRLADGERVKVFNASGMKGKSIFVRLLYYIQYTTSFLVPFMHTFFRGAFRDFVKEVVSDNGRAELTVQVRARRNMKHRWQKMTMPKEFNRPGRDPISHIGDYTIEELARLCDVWLPLMCFQVCM